MSKRNLLIVAIAVSAVLLAAVLAAVVPHQRVLSDDAPTLANDSEGTAAQTASSAAAYLLLSVKGILYEPIPLTEEATYTVRQKENGAENVIHVTPESIVMESSTCDNQDCVLQGEVTLENLSSRVLGNMIICLPNEVTLELHTPESLAEVLQMEE